MTLEAVIQQHENMLQFVVNLLVFARYYIASRKNNDSTYEIFKNFLEFCQMWSQEEHSFWISQAIPVAFGFREEVEVLNKHGLL